MSEPRQLVVLGSSLTALAVVRNAHALGLRVVLMDRVRGVAFNSRCVDQSLQVDGADDKSLWGILRQLAGNTSAALVADSDDWLVWVQAYREDLESSGWTVLHPHNDVLETCLDKQRFAEWCAAAGLPCPHSQTASATGDLPPGVDYPVFVRPRTTRHAELHVVPKAVVAHNPVELQVALDRFARWEVAAVVSRSLLAVGLRQYSYGFARRADGVQCGLLTEKLRPWPEQCATGSLVATTRHPAVQDLAQRAVDALGFVGIGEVELLANHRTGELHLIEINARPWLQYGLALATGRDLLQFQLRPQTYDARRESDASRRWISLGNDLFNCFSRQAGLVRLGKLSVREYVASLFGRQVWAAWQWRDPWPGWELTKDSLNRLWRGASKSAAPGANSSLEDTPPRSRRPSRGPALHVQPIAVAGQRADTP